MGIRCFILTVRLTSAHIVLSLPWIALLTFDSVILLFTVYNAKDSMKAWSDSIAAILVRDGALYFL